MRLAAPAQTLLVVFDDGTEHVVPQVWLPPYWQRTPGDYTGDYARWNEVSLHRGADALWLRVVSLCEYDGGGTHPVDDRALRSDDGGRSWTGLARTPRDVVALPVIAQLTTHPSCPPRAPPDW